MRHQPDDLLICLLVFRDVELRKNQNLFSLGIVSYQYRIIVNKTDYAVSVALDFISIPGNDDDVCTKGACEILDQITWRLLRILLKDLCGHDNFASAVNDIATINLDASGIFQI